MTEELRKNKVVVYHPLSSNNGGRDPSPFIPARDIVQGPNIIRSTKLLFVPSDLGQPGAYVQSLEAGRAIRSGYQVYPSPGIVILNGVIGQNWVATRADAVTSIVRVVARPLVAPKIGIPKASAYIDIDYGRAWDAGAKSVLHYQGNVDYHFQIPKNVYGIIVGLSTEDYDKPTYEYGDIQYGIEFTGNRFRIIENGAIQTPYFLYDDMDTFHVNVNNGIISYKKNSDNYYTSAGFHFHNSYYARTSIYASDDVIFNSEVTLANSIAAGANLSIRSGYVTAYDYAYGINARVLSGQVAALGQNLYGAQLITDSGRVLSIKSGYQYIDLQTRSGSIAASNIFRPADRAGIYLNSVSGFLYASSYQPIVQSIECNTPSGRALGLYTGYQFIAARARSGFVSATSQIIQLTESEINIANIGTEWSDTGEDFLSAAVNINGVGIDWQDNTAQWNLRIPSPKVTGLLTDGDFLRLTANVSFTVDSNRYNLIISVPGIIANLDLSETSGNKIGYVCNLHYDDGPEITKLAGGLANFIRIVRIGQKIYGVKQEGIYEITGNTFGMFDAISASFEINPNNFGYPYIKRCRAVFGGFSSSVLISPVKATINHGPFQTFRGKNNQWVAPMPLGLTDQFWSFKIQNIDGQNLKCAWLQPIFDNLYRRTA